MVLRILGDALAFSRCAYLMHNSEGWVLLPMLIERAGRFSAFRDVRGHVLRETVRRRGERLQDRGMVETEKRRGKFHAVIWVRAIDLEAGESR